MPYGAEEGCGAAEATEQLGFGEGTGHGRVTTGGLGEAGLRETESVSAGRGSGEYGSGGALKAATLLA